jgi:hypothetical protein
VPPRRSNRAPLLIGLAVLVVGALVAGIVFFTTRGDNTTNTANTPSATVTVSPSSSSPSESDSPTSTPSASDSEAPSDSDARTAAEEFMTDLKDKQFSLARVQLCEAGQTRFSTGAALQKELGLDTKSVASFTITKVEPKVFNSDPRKDVTVKVTYTPTGSQTLTLSVTQEHEQPKICGF